MPCCVLSRSFSVMKLGVRKSMSATHKEIISSLPKMALLRSHLTQLVPRLSICSSKFQSIVLFFVCKSRKKNGGRLKNDYEKRDKAFFACVIIYFNNSIWEITPFVLFISHVPLITLKKRDNTKGNSALSFEKRIILAIFI